jgi:hypothetical protein
MWSLQQTGGQGDHDRPYVNGDRCDDFTWQLEAHVLSCIMPGHHQQLALQGGTRGDEVTACKAASDTLASRIILVNPVMTFAMALT